VSVSFIVVATAGVFQALVGVLGILLGARLGRSSLSAIMWFALSQMVAIPLLPAVIKLAAPVI
jgi:hypothetical protein